MRVCQAAELLLAVLDEELLDEEALALLEEAEEDDEVEEDDVEDVDFDAGVLLDDEPRLSFR